MVVGCLAVVAGGAEAGPGVLAGAVVGSTAALRGLAVETAWVVLGKAVLGSSAVVFRGANARLDGAITVCAAGAAGSPEEVFLQLNWSPDLRWAKL